MAGLMGIGGITPVADLRFAPEVAKQSLGKGGVTERLEATVSTLMDAVDSLERLADRFAGRVVMPPNQMAQANSARDAFVPAIPSTALFDVLDGHMDTLVHLRTRMQAAIKRVEERL